MLSAIEEKGQGLVEYAIILALVALIVIARFRLPCARAAFAELSAHANHKVRQ